MDVTLTPFGGPGAPCTLLHSDALDVRIVLDCGATTVGRPSEGGLALLAPGVCALAASAPPSRRDDACPFADAVLLTSPAAVLALPLLYRAAADEQQRRRRQRQRQQAGDDSEQSEQQQQQQQQDDPLPPLPLHTYATEACLEMAEHWIAELLDAERQARNPAKDESTNHDGGDSDGGNAAVTEKTTTTTTTTPTTTPLFSARDARRALSCVRAVYFGERLPLPGGGRVVAEAIPASGARLGVCAWRLYVGATDSVAYVGPCASSLRGHAQVSLLSRAMEGARVVVLGPGAVGQREGAAPAAGDDDEKEAALLFAPGRPRPPLLEQSLRSDSDPADVRHAVAVHRAARAALDAVRAARAAAAEGGAAAAAATVVVDPTGAAFDFLEALEYEARYPPGCGGEGDEEDLEEEHQEDEEEEEEEEGQLRQRRRQRPRPPSSSPPGAPPLRVLYAGPAAEDSLALGTSAADYLSPGRQHRVVRRAAAPFAHCRMLVGEGEGSGEGNSQGGGGSGSGGRAGAAVELRVQHGGGKQALQPPPDILIVPAARVLAGLNVFATGGRVILLGTAADSAGAAAAAAGTRRPPPLCVLLPGERGVFPAALAAALASSRGPPSSSSTRAVVAVASEQDARALRRAAPALLDEAAVVVFGGAAAGRACALPPALSPLYEAWISGPLAARAVLTPLPRAPGRPAFAPPLSAARLPRVRLGLERGGGGGGGGAWRVDEEEDEEEEDENEEGGLEAALIAALRRGGFEVLGRRLEEQGEGEEDEGSGGGGGGDGGGGAAVVLSVAAAAEVRLALAGRPPVVRSVLVLSEDSAVRERLRRCCEEGLGGTGV